MSFRLSWKIDDLGIASAIDSRPYAMLLLSFDAKLML